MKGFGKDTMEENLWMNVEDAVKQSLEAVRSRRIIFIPGELYPKMMCKLRERNAKKWANCKVI